jgi:hypothetical protein
MATHAFAARSSSMLPLSGRPAVVTSTTASSLSAPVRGLKRKSYSAGALGGDAAERRGKGVVEVPEYVTADHLAHLLKKPLAQLAKLAVRTFPEWWPKQTERQMKKEAYGTAKSIVLKFEDSARLAELCKRTAVLKDRQSVPSDICDTSCTRGTCID